MPKSMLLKKIRSMPYFSLFSKFMVQKEPMPSHLPGSRRASDIGPLFEERHRDALEKEGEIHRDFLQFYRKGSNSLFYYKMGGT